MVDDDDCDNGDDGDFFFLFWAAQHSGAEHLNTTPAPIHHPPHRARCGPYRCTTPTARMTSSVLIMSTSLHTHVLAHIHTSPMYK